MDLFHKAKAVRLKSAHGKFLTADDDEDSVTLQDRDASSGDVMKWAVEFVDDNSIRLKSRYGKYLTASNHPVLLGTKGRKVTQTLPNRLDGSVEWVPVWENGAVQLKTRQGRFLRAHGGLPPWRNSVTHDVPHRASSMAFVLWEVHVLEIVESPEEVDVLSSPEEVEVLASESESPPRDSGGRLIYFHIADENGKVDDAFEEMCITFKGNGVNELSRRLMEELGVVDGVTVCSRSPLNGKLYPLRLHLPPNNATMHVVVLPEIG